MALDPDAVQTTAGISAIIAGFLLKHLHGKISEAVGKAELAEALRVVAVQRAEDMQRAELYRQERRQTEAAIFERLRLQDSTLARIDERTQRMERNK